MIILKSRGENLGYIKYSWGVMEYNRRILIVDDQQDLCEQLAKLLSRAGKKSETISLVQQMRTRLLGSIKSEADESGEGEEPQYIVDIALQGKEAFEKIKKSQERGEPYAVMFLDMRMPPGWDGLETAKNIRELDRNIEIVIMTAYADHDQQQIAETVGLPEKLLYIKKPFQAEEIYQLALSLTTKWSLEQAEKQRKQWLEILLHDMSKIKSSSMTEKDEFYPTALKSFLDFTDASKGFIVSWDELRKKWKIEASLEMDKMEAENFIKDNSSRLSESRTTQHIEGKYLLPLKKNDFSAIVVIYNVATKSDPEWYKLLSLLVMTATEVISNTISINDQIKKEHFSAMGFAISKVSHESKNMLNQILGYASMIKEKLSAKSDAREYIDKLVESGEAMLRMLQNLLIYGKDQAISVVPCDLVQIIKTGCENSSVNFSKQIEKVISGPSELKIKADPEILQRVFSNLTTNAVVAAIESGKKKVKLTIAIKEEDNKVRINFEDNGPGISEDIRESLFDPFVSGKKAGGVGLGLSIVKQIIEKHNGSIIYDSGFSGGARFVIELQKPQD